MAQKLFIILLMFVLSPVVHAQLVIRQPLPVTEKEALDAVEQVLGLKLRSIDMAGVHKYRARTNSSVLEIDWDSPPFALPDGGCTKRHHHLWYPEWEKDKAKLRSLPYYFQSWSLMAEKPQGPDACNAVGHWFRVSPSLEYGGIIDFLPKLREWAGSVSEADFCKALAKGEGRDKCDSLWKTLRKNADLSNLTYIELFECAHEASQCHNALEFHFKVGKLETMVLNLFGTDDVNDPFQSIGVSWLIV
ncbi:hypothetical protein [Kordiimonas marina]|uniref:hypothetical protein n=1 Tax=Kordiimonas marina TaxID=2872312 RepID=UPI001FF2FB98|nr:hypothetical protein [Kordiimonas marina]MCJ9429444.1 hypothetical protein [Kordiimonas marina]